MVIGGSSILGRRGALSIIISDLQNHRKINNTVPLKGKLTVLTRFSKLDSCAVKVETFEFQDARIESQESRVEDRESRNEEFWNIHDWNLCED